MEFTYWLTGKLWQSSAIEFPVTTIDFSGIRTLDPLVQVVYSNHQATTAAVYVNFNMTIVFSD